MNFGPSKARKVNQVFNDLLPSSIKWGYGKAWQKCTFRHSPFGSGSSPPPSPYLLRGGENGKCSRLRKPASSPSIMKPDGW